MQRRRDSDSSQEKTKIPKAPHYKCETLSLDPTHLDVELWRSEIQQTNSIIKKLLSDKRVLINWAFLRLYKGWFER